MGQIQLFRVSQRSFRRRTSPMSPLILAEHRDQRAEKPLEVETTTSMAV